jgi:hypothetical protein
LSNREETIYESPKKKVRFSETIKKDSRNKLNLIMKKMLKAKEAEMKDVKNRPGEFITINRVLKLAESSLCCKFTNVNKSR